MTSRERFLGIVFLCAVLLVGGGGMFHLFFWKPYTNLRSRLETAKKDLATKRLEKDRETKAIHDAQTRDPRLTRWDMVSLPESASRDPDKLQRHVSQERVEYERGLSEMLKKAGFQGISTAAKPVDARNVPQFVNKTPIYTRLAYTVEGKASFKNVVDLLETFYRDDKLHQVREFKLRKPQTSTGGRTNGNRGGRGFAIPGAIPGAAPIVGQPAAPDRSILDVTMTVEALIVSGAKTRDARLTSEEKARAGAAKTPKKAPSKPKTLDLDPWDEEGQEEAPPTPTATAPVGILAPHRHYEDMLYKNIFTGLATKIEEGRLTEDPRLVLGAVKLVMIEKLEKPTFGWFESSQLWKVELYDQGAGKYHHYSPDESDAKEFEITDRHGATVIKGTVVDANIHGIVIKVDKLYYHMRLGDFLDEVMHPEKDDSDRVILDPEREPMEKYTRGDWKGPSTSGKSGEDASGILKVVKLAKCVDTGRRWEVEFHDAGRKLDYHCTPDSSVKNSFEVMDRQKNVLLKGTVVDANSLGVVVKVDDHFYKMKLGESFEEILDPAHVKDNQLKEYNRGDWKAPPAPPMTEEKKDEAK